MAKHPKPDAGREKRTMALSATQRPGPSQTISRPEEAEYDWKRDGEAQVTKQCSHCVNSVSMPITLDGGYQLYCVLKDLFEPVALDCKSYCRAPGSDDEVGDDK